jgi:hypothetical protein
MGCCSQWASNVLTHPDSQVSRVGWKVRAGARDSGNERQTEIQKGQELQEGDSVVLLQSMQSHFLFPLAHHYNPVRNAFICFVAKVMHHFS